MTERTVYRGDDYVLRRQVFTLTIVDADLQPFNMAECTIRSTFKSGVFSHEEDPTDATSPLKVYITFGVGGTVLASDGLMLPLGGTAAGGVLWLTADRADTLALPLNQPLISDVEIVDANGERTTIMSVWTLKARDGVTNRTVD